MTRLKEQDVLIKGYQQKVAQMQRLAEAGAEAEHILREKDRLEGQLREFQKT